MMHRVYQIRMKTECSATLYRLHMHIHYVFHPKWLAHVHGVSRFVRFRWTLSVLCKQQRLVGHSKSQAGVSRARASVPTSSAVPA